MLYVIQCDAEVPPGLIGSELQKMHASWELVRLDQGDRLPAMGGMDALIVLGGRMSVHDEQAFPFLADLKPFIKTAVNAGLPYLGICLGAQLLAAALGADVVENRWGEQGNRKVSLTRDGIGDPLLGTLPQQPAAFQWHDDSFDLPDGAVLLATSPVCPHQAFRVRNAWGVQFHPEVTPEIISAWAADETANQEALLVFEWMEKEKEYLHSAHLVMKKFREMFSGS